MRPPSVHRNHRSLALSALVALLVVLIHQIPQWHPEWFVSPGGRIVVYYPAQVSALGVGLLLGWRWVRYLALALLGLGAVVFGLLLLTFDLPFWPGALLMLLLHLCAIVALVTVRPVRRRLVPVAA